MSSRTALLLALLATATAHADFSRVVGAYQSLLEHGDGSVAAGPLSDVISEEVENDSEFEFALIVPVVKQCLHSDNPAIRREGLILLMTYNVRPDSARLLDPYIDDVVGILVDTAPGLKGMAAGVLGGASPVPSDASVRALAFHLNDRNSSAREFLAIAAALLTARPTDVSIVHAVLAGVAKYPGDHLDSEIIQRLGNLRITSIEALTFIRAGFANVSVRPTSIDAIGRMPATVQDSFAKELQSILADPTADAQTKSAASHVLMKR